MDTLFQFTDGLESKRSKEASVEVKYIGFCSPISICIHHPAENHPIVLESIWNNRVIK